MNNSTATLMILCFVCVGGTLWLDWQRDFDARSRMDRLERRIEAAERRLGLAEEFAGRMTRARFEDVEAVNRATSNLWCAVTNSAAGVGRTAVRVCAERLRDHEDRMLESHERRLKRLEESYGRRRPR